MFPDQVTFSRAAVNARNYSSLVALIFTLAEYTVTINSEYRYIWKWRAPLWSPKGLYFLARYLGVTIQIVNYSLVQIYLNRGPVQRQQCKTWFILLASSTSVLFTIFEAVLVLRVYALYRKNAKIYFIVAPLLLRYIIPSLMVGKNALRNDSFNSYCDVTDTPTEVGLSGGLTILAHLPLWVATFWKRHEADSSEVARLVVHEGSWAFGLLAIYMGGILSYCVATGAGNPFAIFVLPNVALSMGSCRMIINMRTLKPGNPEQENTPHNSSSIAFTTYINSHFTIEEILMDHPKDKPKDEAKDEGQKGPACQSSP